MIGWTLGLLLVQLPLVESKDIAKDVQTRAVAATVQVLGGKGQSGSGVVVGHGGPFAYVLTAGHVVEAGDKLEVLLYTAESHPKPARVVRGAEVVARDKGSDLAVVRFAAREAPPLVRICPPRLGPGDKGLAVLLVGCGEGQGPTGAVDRAQVRKVAGKAADAAGGLVWEVTSSPAKGRSGGPMIDGRGLVVGICSGTSAGKGYYVHLDDIHRFLKQEGFGWLSEEPKE